MEDLVFDQNEALRLSLGDIETLNEVIEFLLEDIEFQMSDIDRAIKKESSPHISLAAHKLKGSAGSIAAKRLYHSCFDLEQAAKSDEKEKYIKLYEIIKIECEILLNALKKSQK